MKDETQEFGGKWTIDKLSILSKYLNAYITALKNQRGFEKIYIDAFAGSGEFKLKSEIDISYIDEKNLHYSIDDDTSSVIIQGSTEISLNLFPPFNKYIFIEKDPEYLEKLKLYSLNKYPHLYDKVHFKNGDCNSILENICKNTDWTKNRALLFLDPYGMSVDWKTLELISSTKSIDVWYLFPIGAINRLLKKDGNINEKHRKKIDATLGTEEWFDYIYKEDRQISFFDEPMMNKEINFNSLGKYINKRLETIFPAVAKNPKMLYTRTNVPLFLFCFAISNESPKAKQLALKLSEHILNKS